MSCSATRRAARTASKYSKRDKYPDSPAVDAYILLANVSDREMASLFLPPDQLERSAKAAKALIDQSRNQEIMPKGSTPELFYSPVTEYRWYLLAAKGYVSANYHFLPDRTNSYHFATTEETTTFSHRIFPTTNSRQPLARSTSPPYFCRAKKMSWCLRR